MVHDVLQALPVLAVLCGPWADQPSRPVAMREGSEPKGCIARADIREWRSKNSPTGPLASVDKRQAQASSDAPASPGIVDSVARLIKNVFKRPVGDWKKVQSTP